MKSPKKSPKAVRTSSSATTTPSKSPSATKSPALKKGKAPKDRRQSLNRRVSFSRHVGVMLFEKENKAPKTSSSSSCSSSSSSSSTPSSSTLSSALIPTSPSRELIGANSGTSAPLISSLLDFGATSTESDYLPSTSTGLGKVYADRTDRTDMVLKSLSFYQQGLEDDGQEDEAKLDRTERTDVLLKSLFQLGSSNTEMEDDFAAQQQASNNDRTERTDTIFKSLSFLKPSDNAADEEEEEGRGEKTDMALETTSFYRALNPAERDDDDMQEDGFTTQTNINVDRTERTDMVLKSLSFYQRDEDDEDEDEDSGNGTSGQGRNQTGRIEKVNLSIEPQDQEADEIAPQDKTDVVFKSLSFNQDASDSEDDTNLSVSKDEDNATTATGILRRNDNLTTSLGDKTDMVFEALSFARNEDDLSSGLAAPTLYARSPARSPKSPNPESRRLSQTRTPTRDEDSSDNLELQRLLAQSNALINSIVRGTSLPHEQDEDEDEDMQLDGGNSGLTVLTSGLRLQQHQGNSTETLLSSSSSSSNSSNGHNTTNSNLSSTSLGNLSGILSGGSHSAPNTPARGSTTANINMMLTSTPTASSSTAMRLMTMTPTASSIALPAVSASTSRLPASTSALSSGFNYSNRRNSRGAATPTKLPSMGSLASLIPQSTVSESIAALVASPGASLRRSGLDPLLLDEKDLLPVSTASAPGSNGPITLEEFLAATKVRFLDDVAAKRRRSSMGGLLARRQAANGAAATQVSKQQQLATAEGRTKRLKELLVSKPELDALEKACEHLTATTEELRTKTREQTSALSANNPPIFAAASSGVSGMMKAVKNHCRAEAKLQKKKLQLETVALPLISSLEANFDLVRHDRSVVKKSALSLKQQRSSLSAPVASIPSTTPTPLPLPVDEVERIQIFKERSKEVKKLEKQVKAARLDYEALEGLHEWRLSMQQDPLTNDTVLRFVFHNQFEVLCRVLCGSQTISTFDFSHPPLESTNPAYTEFANAMVNSAKIPELLRNVQSTMELSDVMTELSLRLGRIHDLFGELDNIRRLYSNQVRLTYVAQPSPAIQFSFEASSANSIGGIAAPSLVLSSAEEAKKSATVTFSDLEYSYPFCPMRVSVKEVKGNINEDNLNTLLERLVQQRTYGFFQRFCISLISICR